jgi:hypothetical protein
MKRFFRAQEKGILFEDMINYISSNGGDSDDEQVEGLCACSTPDGKEGGSRFGGAWNALDDDDEIVIFYGVPLYRIYDGWRVKPVKEIARFTIKQWSKMIKSGEVWDYEE